MIKVGDYVVAPMDGEVAPDSMPWNTVLKIAAVDNPVVDRLPFGALTTHSGGTYWFAEKELRLATEEEILTAKLLGEI